MTVIKDQAWLKSLCRSYTEANVRTLGGWAVGENIDPDLKMRAINMLMDRGWGKPQQDQTHEIKGEIKVVLRQMLDDDDDDKGGT